VAYETLGIQLEVKGLSQFKTEMGQVKTSINGTTTETKKAAPSFLEMAGAVTAGILASEAFIKIAEKLVGVLQDSVAAASKNETSMMHLTATLRSTGRESEITATQIAKFAESMMLATSFDDEAIIDAYNAMAKFENINTGDLEKVLRVAMDMTAALGGDLATNAEGIARVLETGLIPRSWGFTAALKEQVRELVNAGKSSEALTLILDQLNKRYGGQAQAEMDTYAGKVKHLEVSFGELKEKIGKELLPTLTKVVTELDKLLFGVQDQTTAEGILTDKIKETTKSYREYVEASIRAKLASRGFTDTEIEKFVELDMRSKTLIATAKLYDLLTESEYNLSEVKIDSSDLALMFDVVENGTPSVKELGKAIETTKTNWKDMLNAGMSAAMEYRQYAKSMSDANEKLAEDMKKLSQLDPLDTQGIKDTTAAIEEDRVAIARLKEEHRIAMLEMIAGWYETSLAADGVFDENDMARILNYRLQMGLLSKDEYNAGLEAINLARAINGLPPLTSLAVVTYYSDVYTGGAATSAATLYAAIKEGGAAAVNKAKEAEAKAVAAKAATALKASSQYRTNGYATGGAFTVPPGFNNDDYMARFTSGELVMAFTKAQQRAMAAPLRAMNQSNYTRNVNYNYNPSYGSAPNNPSFDFAIMQARGEA